jgi:hypothetical protein
MEQGFLIARLSVAGSMAAIFALGISGIKGAVLEALFAVFFFSAAYCGFYSYANPNRMADRVGKKGVIKQSSMAYFSVYWPRC